ncbi:MAG TPA: hypothetical protein VK578_20605 [Edaphobacter sp.]|nr:hypothetical protein [Edaphobacter sp.]
MMTLIQDVRYALRQLRKTPAFKITVLLTLPFGIGANVAVMSLGSLRAFCEVEPYEITSANGSVMVFAVVTLAVVAGLAGIIPARP